MLLRAFLIFSALIATITAGSGSALADPGRPCTPALAGAMTWPAGDVAPLVCADGAWAAVADPYPISDRWLSVGPALTLHGEGRRNPQLESGDWTATALTTDTRCSATQLAVVPGSPTVGPPRVDRGDRGAALSLQVVPHLFSIEFGGDCLWQRVT
jgi:hypothetical protein